MKLVKKSNVKMPGPDVLGEYLDLYSKIFILGSITSFKQRDANVSCASENCMLATMQRMEQGRQK